MIFFIITAPLKKDGFYYLHGFILSDKQLKYTEDEGFNIIPMATANAFIAPRTETDTVIVISSSRISMNKAGQISISTLHFKGPNGGTNITIKPSAVEINHENGGDLCRLFRLFGLDGNEGYSGGLLTVQLFCAVPHSQQEKPEGCHRVLRIYPAAINSG